MGGKVDGIILRIEKMRREKDEEGRTLGEIARESARDMKEDNPASVIVNTALAMNWEWETHARPRLDQFKRHYPNVESLSDLKGLLDSMSERDFCRKVLGFNSTKPGNPRYRMLNGLVEAFLDYKRRNGLKDDWEVIQKWGRQVNPDDVDNDPVVGGMEGVGLATVQNIKIVSGFNTSKPDRRVNNVLSYLGVGNPVQIVALISELTHIRSIELDQLFWYWLEKHQSTIR